MPRISRIVVPGTAHHVTQRGNRRQQTFFGPADYAMYLDLIAECCRAAQVEVLAWCLMPNHDHLVAVPTTTDSPRAALALAHRSYTWTLNRRNGWTGHLWQDRFVSSPMDDAHTIADNQVRRVEPSKGEPCRGAGGVALVECARPASGAGDRLVSSDRPDLLQHVADWASSPRD